ncbi:MAG: energy transducer TonB [Planctomycetes bacterium]|nr:energy transducer TonB [Planctomycetota bacterium]
MRVVISYGTSLVFHVAALTFLYQSTTTLPSYDIIEGRATIELMASAASRAEPEKELTKPIEVTLPQPSPSESSPAPFEVAKVSAVPVTKEAFRRLEPALDRPIPTTVVEPTRMSEEYALSTDAMELKRKPREPEKELAAVDSEATPASDANDGSDIDELPRPLSNRKVPYPAEAVRNRLTGRVLAAVWVAADGSVTRVTLDRSSGHEILDKAALEMLREWRFHPARRRGVPVPYEVNIPVNFGFAD